MNSVLTKQSPLVALANKIASESNRPMSLDEIKGKFQLQLPFTVKRVAPPATNLKASCGCPFGLVIGEHITLVKIARHEKQGLLCYEMPPCPHGEIGTFYPDRKAYVLV